MLGDARALGFLGPGPVVDHLRHAEGFAVAWGGPPPALVVDLGSGGGVPGLVLARTWPDATVVLVDSNERRTAFLERAASSLRLDGVRVRRARAEVVGHESSLRGAADLVTARSFAPPAVTAECSAPLLRVGGRLVVSEPPDANARWPMAPLADLGMALLRLVRAPASFAVLTQVAACPQRFPRRVGIPAKRPLF